MKMITIVGVLEFSQALFFCVFLFFSQGLDLRHKYAYHLFFCDAAYFCIILAHRNIPELIQVTENTDLAE